MPAIIQCINKDFKITIIVVMLGEPAMYNRVNIQATVYLRILE